MPKNIRHIYRFCIFLLAILFLLSSCSYSKTVIDLNSLWDSTWDFNQSSNYSFDSNYVEIKNGKAQLKPLDLEHSGADFNNGNHVGTSFFEQNLVFNDKKSPELDLRKILSSKVNNQVAYWKFENSMSEENGEFPFSISGAGNFTPDSIVGSHSLELNGSGSYATFSPNNKLPQGSSPLSIIFWYRIGNDANSYFISYGENSGAGHRIELYYQNPNLISIGVSGHRFDFPWDFDTNWHHMALVFPTGSTLTDEWVLYIDGTNISGGVTAAGSPRTMDIIPSEGVIGSNIALAASMNGEIDELAIYDVELMSDDIVKTYSSQSLDYTSLSPNWTPKWDSIVGYWKMDGNWQDSSGNENHGTALGAAGFNSDSQVGIQSGVFNGVDSRVDFGDVLDLVGSPISISFWTKPLNPKNQASIVDKFSSDGNYRVIQNADGRFLFNIHDNVGTFQNLASNYQANSNEWVHVFVTFNNTNTAKIYINGKLDSYRDDISVVRSNTSSSLRLGHSPFNGIYYEGHIDEVSLWNTEVESSSVFNIYNRQKQKYAGHYDSEVIDLGNSNFNWPDLSWSTSLPFGKELVGDLNSVGNPDGESSSDYSGLSSDLSNGLVGYWNFNLNADDFSGNSLDGILLDNANTQSIGVLGNSLDLKETSDRVHISDDPALEFNGVDFTLSSWVKIDVATPSHRMNIINKHKYNLYFDEGSQKFQFFIYDTAYCTIRSSLSPNITNWNHLTIVVRRSSSCTTSDILLYLNGELDTGATIITNNVNTNASLDSSHPFVFGANPFNAFLFNGKLDEAAAWSRSLNANEIQQLYRRGANRIKFQVKSCVDSSCECKSLSTSPVGTATDCDGDTIVNALDFDDIHKAEFIGPGGDGTTYYSELFNRKATDLTFNCGLNSSDSNSNVCVNDEITLNAGPRPTSPVIDYSDFPLAAKPADNRYFQYRVYMEADENTACNGSPCLPELSSVNLNPSGLDKYYGVIQEVVPNNSITYKAIKSITIDADSCASFQLSPDGTDYYYWNSPAWDIVSDPSHRSSKLDLTNHIIDFAAQFGPGKLYIKSFLETGPGLNTNCTINDIDVDYAAN